ncbi:MAG: hypothetical protein AABY50_10900 [Nitrospirota bacterium]
MKNAFVEKRYSEATRKLHLPCPHSGETGINIHVVLKNGVCYRSDVCMVIKCKFNRIQSDVKALLSLVW